MPAAYPPSTFFYRDLPALSSFADAALDTTHADVPDDWWVVIADIENSTQAIANGEYKKVNTVGVACIAAVANIDRSLDLPFLFGGDGASFAVPDAIQMQVISALRAAQKLAREGFALDLRAGMVRVSDLREAGMAVRLAKLRQAGCATQPVMAGNGWAEVERRLKTAKAKGILVVEEKGGAAQASFEGFECRWEGVPSFHDHKLALLVAAVVAEPAQMRATYQRALQEIHTIYGDESQYHPLRVERMRMTFSPSLLAHEWRVKTQWKGLAARLAYAGKMLFQNAAGSYLFSRNRDTEATQWTRYRQDMVMNSDFRKFDGMLRMVIDGSDAQAQRLQQFLEHEYQGGRLVYGMHTSREALVTCMVRSYNGDHQHFVDGSDGGYAVASRALKQRAAEFATRTVAAVGGS